MFKKEFIDETNLTFDESLPNHEDWVFWTKLFYYSKCIKNNQNVLAFYRIHGTSMSVDFKAMKRGFLKAALVLNAFFKLENNKELALKLSLNAFNYSRKHFDIETFN